MVPIIEDNEKEEFEDIEDSGNDSLDEMDVELRKIRLVENILGQLFDKGYSQNFQISRLTGKEIWLLSAMESIDKMMGIELYNKITNPYRTHKISLIGGSRKELVDIIKSLSSNDGYMQDGERVERLGLLGRFRKRFTGGF